MGRGNWFPGPRLEDCRLVYIDYSNPDIECDDQDAWEWEYDYVKDIIFDALPKSFNRIKDYNDFPWRLRQPHWNDCSPLAYNELFTLWLDNHGEPHHQGIGFKVNEDAPAFAAYRLDSMANKFFDTLSESLDLSVRRCAWTSGKYVRSDEKTTVNAES